jgi:hypothetical protein
MSQAHWEWVKTYVHGKIVAWREDNAISDCAAETAARGFVWQLFLHRSIYLIGENACLRLYLLLRSKKKQRIEGGGAAGVRI